MKELKLPKLQKPGPGRLFPMQFCDKGLLPKVKCLNLDLNKIVFKVSLERRKKGDE